MQTFDSLLWIVLALSIGIPVVFVMGVRLMAYRLAGRPGTMPTPEADTFSVPTLRFAARWRVLRTLLMVLVLGTGTGIIFCLRNRRCH
jgi:hypothetical protein